MTPATRTGYATHVGLIRQVNEDAYLVQPEGGLWAVSDGMGGHAAGDEASRIVVSELASIGLAAGIEDLEARILARLSKANDLVRRYAADTGLDTIGATVVALLLHGDDACCAWSGDSRLYRSRDGRIDQLTTDHSEVAALLAAGAITAEEARAWPRRNVITRAIGVMPEAEVEVARFDVRPGDLFCLCSDGVTEYLTAAEIDAEILRLSPQGASDRIIEHVLDRGARDNATVVVVEVCEPGGRELDPPVAAETT